MGVAVWGSADALTLRIRQGPTRPSTASGTASCVSSEMRPFVGARRAVPMCSCRVPIIAGCHSEKQGSRRDRLNGQYPPARLTMFPQSVLINHIV